MTLLTPLIRRSIAGAVAIGTCLAATSASAQINADVTASRVSGVAPLAVYFDATGTTGSTVSHPFHELYYEWDFDDVNAGTWAVTGKEKNFATGPVAAHVFEEPGTYTVTVHAEDEFGNSDVDSIVITVANPATYYSGSNTICFSTSGNFSGKPSGAAEQQVSSFDQVLSYVGSGKRLLLRRGETFTTSGNKHLTTNGPVTIGAFGSGSAKPIISCSNATTILKFDGDDWRFMDLRFTGSGQSGSWIASQRGYQAKNILFFRCEGTAGTLDGGWKTDYIGLKNNGEDLHDGLFLVENDLRNIGFGSGSCHVFISANRFALLGNYFDDVEDGEHVIRAQHLGGAVISNNYLGRQHTTKQVITIRNMPQNQTCSTGCGEDTRDIVVSDNLIFSNSAYAIQFIHQNNPADTVFGRDIIFERNYIAASPSSHNTGVDNGIKGYSTSHVTVRNNIINMNGWFIYEAIEIGAPYVWVYNNTAYTNSSTSKDVHNVKLDGGSNQVVRNNLLYAPNATGNTVVVNSHPQTKSNNLDLSNGSNPFVSSNPTNPGDFKLANGSAAIDAGAQVPVYRDFATVAVRPISGQWDVGAYEHGSGSGGTSVPVTGVSLSPATLNLTISGTAALTATVSPGNATNKGVSWSSSNSSIASVNSSGVVTAHAAGNATITVTTNDGNFQDTTAVSVSSSSTGTNIALNKPVSQSTTGDNGGTTPDGLTDGNLGNTEADRWSSLNFTKWATVDLGSVSTITEFRVHPLDNRAYKYTISVSNDNSNFTTVVNRSNNTTSASVLTNSVTGVSARYVRITVTGATNYSGSWVSIRELEVIGTAGSGGSSGPEDFIIDNVDPEVSFPVGDFWLVTTGSGYQGSNFHTATYGYARYSPDFSGRTGTYEIFVRYGSSWQNLGTDCPYTVNHANGQTTVDVDQTTGGGTWVSIGTYEMDASSYVDIGTNLSNGKRPCVDAIRFVK